MSYILVTNNAACHPVYEIVSDGASRPLVFDDQYAAVQHITYDDPIIGSGKTHDYKAANLNQEALRRYVEWANLTLPEVKQWLKVEKQKGGAL